MKNAKAYWIKSGRDIGPWLALAVAAALAVVKLLLCSAQQVYLMDPGEMALDDMLMYGGAVSITEGDWLGTYNWLTLSKYSFFSLWLAGLHVLGVPYLLGGQLLWLGAASAGACAFLPALKKRWGGLLLFAALWLNPASTANPEPYAFVTRVYRDNIYPALCLVCVAGVIGFALRCRLPLRKSVGWLALGGLGLAAGWLCREDGWWIAIFVGAALAVCALWVWMPDKAAGTAKAAEEAKAAGESADGPASPAGQGGLAPQKLPVKAKLLRTACLLLPAAMCAAALLGWSAMNQKHYGRFIISDFSTGEFAGAYGAMARVEHENWQPKIGVPKDVRLLLYGVSPAFARLQPLLEEGAIFESYAGNSEYNSGAFYWALRAAAGQLGIYDDPQTAQAYWRQVADEINTACDDGRLMAGKPRSSVSPPIRAEYVGPVLAEMRDSLVLCLTFGQCDARSLFSPGSNNAAYYEAEIRPMEEFLHDEVLRVTQENSVEPYYSLAQKAGFAGLDVIRWVFRLLCPPAFAAAVWWLGWRAAAFAKDKTLRGFTMQNLLWMVQLGLLLCILLRAAMIAFVTVAQFNIGTYVMYLASIHPLLLMFTAVGVWRFAADIVRPGAQRQRAEREQQDAGKAGAR